MTLLLQMKPDSSQSRWISSDGPYLPDVLEPDWDSLLARSDSDPLFQSWEWSRTWVREVSRVVAFRVETLEVRSHGEVVALGCFSSRFATHRGMVRARRFELLGNLWRLPGSTMSERCGIMADRSDGEHWTMAVLKSVFSRTEWADLVFSRVEEGGLTDRLVRRCAAQEGCILRVADPLPAYRLPLEGNFSEFLSGLSGPQRLRMFNHRKRLAQLGQVEYWKADIGSIDRFFDELDRVHLRRWGRPACRGSHGRVYRSMAIEMAKRSQLAASLLCVNGRVVSAALNFVKGECEYGIQTAFDPTFNRHVSVGALHLGYIIEDCYQRELTSFDLLGGVGKSTDYKSQFGAQSSRLVCLHVIRAPLLKMLYGTHGMLSRWRGGA